MESFIEDSILALNCSFVGVPTTSLQWIHNGQPLSNSNNLVTITITSGLSNDTSTLQWMNVGFDANGMFTCVATNILGSDRISIGVQILSKFAL